MFDPEVNLNTLELLITYKQVFIIFLNLKQTTKTTKLSLRLNYSILFFQLFLLKHVYIGFKV